MSSADERQALSFDIETLRHLCAAAPDQVPDIFVHRNSSWTVKGRIASAKIDNRGNLHMSEADFLVLKTQLPVTEVGRVREDVTRFRFAIQSHHLQGGRNTKEPVLAREVRKAGLREALGQDGLGRRKKVKLFGRLH